LGLLGSATAYAQEGEEYEKAEAAEAAKNAPALAAAMKEAKVSLASGLHACEKEGTPISGKFEVEDGKLQLSVYTMKGDKFFEVIVDHKTGKTAKSEAITAGEDLSADKAQSGAMDKARVSLRSATEKAGNENKGFQVVS